MPTKCTAGNEVSPVQAAINYLLQLNAASPMFFRYPNSDPYGVAYGGGYPVSGSARGDGMSRKQRLGPPVAGVDGNWKCEDPECSNVNFAHRSNCNRCNKAR